MPPLPSYNGDQSDSDDESELCKYYCVRYTAHDKFTKEDLISWLKSNEDFCCWVIGLETDTDKLHYHIVLGSYEDPKDVRLSCQTFIRQFWLQPDKVKATCVKGFGAAQWNFQGIKAFADALSYAVKWKDVTYDGFTDEQIEEAKHNSYIAPKNKDFKKEYRALLTLFHETEMTVEQFALNYVTLQGKYERIINYTHAVGYALSALSRRSPDEFTKFSNSKINSLLQ